MRICFVWQDDTKSAQVSPRQARQSSNIVLIAFDDDHVLRAKFIV